MFGTDRAVIASGQDRFGRAPFAKSLAKTIGTRTDSSSLVVALYGPWGDGKTSVLNFLRESFEAFPLISCLSFNPWRFDGEDKLLQGFFDTLGDALQIKLATRAEKFGKLIKDYSSALKVAHTGLSDIASIAGSTLSNVPLETMRDRISQLLSESHVQVVVLIDDIDRMEKAEIQALFRLVKLTADFENTVYVLAFDEEMVARAVGERYSGPTSDTVSAGRNFLEKIIQVPLHLPTAKRGKLRSYCLEMIDRVLSDLSISLTESEINDFIYLFDKGVIRQISTPRLAIRYANAIRFSTGVLQGEVFIPDLLILEGLRLFFPALYNRVRKYPDAFLKGVDQRHTVPGEQSLTKVIEQYVDGTIEAREAAQSLVEGLFPRLGRTGYGNDWNRVWARDKRVAATEYFDRYFSYSIDETDISDRLLTDIINGLDRPGTSEKRLKDIITAENAGALIAKLRASEDKYSSRVVKALVADLIASNDRYPDPPSFTDASQPYKQAAILVANLFKQLAQVERQEFALHVIDNSDEFLFLAECVRWMAAVKEPDGEQKVFSEDAHAELTNHLAIRIRSFAEAVQEDPWPFRHKASVKLLYAWRLGLGKEGVAAFVSKQLSDHPTLVFSFLRSVLGSAYDMGTGVPFEPKFERDSYNAIEGIADTDVVSTIIRSQIPDSSLTSYSEIYDRTPDDDETIGRRFLRIHQHVLEERTTKEETAKGESVEPSP